MKKKVSILLIVKDMSDISYQNKSVRGKMRKAISAVNALIPMLLSMLFLVVISASAAHAEGIVASISNPKMILYYNVSPEKPLVFENSIKVNNRNDFPITVKLNTMDDLVYLANLSATSVSLQPNESKEIPYTVTIYRPKYFNGSMIAYKGDVVAAFYKYGNQTVAGALAQTVIIAVKPADGYENATFPTTTTLADNRQQGTSATGNQGSSAASSTTSGNGNSGNGNAITGNAVAGSHKANPWIGVAIFIVIIAVGIAIYLIIMTMGGKK